MLYLIVKAIVITSIINGVLLFLSYFGGKIIEKRLESKNQAAS